MFVDQQWSKRISSAFFYLISVLVFAFAVFPFYWLIITSVKYGEEILTSPPVFVPHSVTLQHYMDIFQSTHIFPFFANSCIIALSTVGLTLLFGSMAAYAVAKTYLSSQLRNGILVFVIIVRMFPPVVIAIPYYVILKSLGLIDTHIGLIVTYVAYCLPFTIWLMVGFFKDLPAGIEEAALIDGCSFWQRFFKVTLPLTLPGLAVTAIFSFILAWREFLFASILTSFEAKTLPVVVATFVSDQYLQWGKMSAIGTLMVVPVIILASRMQKHLVRGLTFGAVKE